ncbi:hypothetical protein PFISCL1PPCAC_27087, partial [Pristionchus fissidentatus]
FILQVMAAIIPDLPHGVDAPSLYAMLLRLIDSNSYKSGWTKSDVISSLCFTPVIQFVRIRVSPSYTMLFNDTHHFNGMPEFVVIPDDMHTLLHQVDAISSVPGYNASGAVYSFAKLSCNIHHANTVVVTSVQTAVELPGVMSAQTTVALIEYAQRRLHGNNAQRHPTIDQKASDTEESAAEDEDEL